jgi:hypothetical protein
MVTEEKTVTTFAVTCDGPALGATCPTRPIQTATDSGLAGILKGMGWRVVEQGGKIARGSPCYCKPCTQMLEAAGKLRA